MPPTLQLTALSFVSCNGQIGNLNVVIVAFADAPKYTAYVRALGLAYGNRVAVRNAAANNWPSTSLIDLYGEGAITASEGELSVPVNSQFALVLGMENVDNQNCTFDTGRRVGSSTNENNKAIWSCMCYSSDDDYYDDDPNTCNSNIPSMFHNRLFVYVLIAISCCVLAMMCRSRQWEGNTHWENLNETPLVMREDVEDLYAEGSWECDVCSFHNEPHSKGCILCGAEKGFLTRSGPLRDTKGIHDGDLSSFSIAGVTVATHGVRPNEISGRFSSGQLSGIPANLSGPMNVTQHFRERQRSFAVRRLNMLNQRQKGYSMLMHYTVC
jgi:hypothetical protein